MAGSSQRGGQLHDGHLDAVVHHLLRFGARSLQEGQGREQRLGFAGKHGQPLHVSPALQVVARHKTEQQSGASVFLDGVADGHADVGCGRHGRKLRACLLAR